MRQNLSVDPFSPSAPNGVSCLPATGSQSPAGSCSPGVDSVCARRDEDLTRVWPSLDGLAFQAHLVALNAVVEAALAGEHGQGFSAVASEMLQLARRTTEVIEDIRSLLKEPQAPA